MKYSLTDEIKFGKHKGKQIQYLIENEISYIGWAIKTIESFDLSPEAWELYHSREFAQIIGREVRRLDRDIPSLYNGFGDDW